MSDDIKRPYSVTVHLTDKRQYTYACTDVELDAEEGTLTLHGVDVQGFGASTPEDHVTFMYRHVTHYVLAHLQV